MTVRFLGWEDPLKEGMATHSHSFLENSKDRGAWRATVHRVAKSRTRLKRLNRQHTLKILVPLSGDHGNSHFSFTLGATALSGAPHSALYSPARGSRRNTRISLVDWPRLLRCGLRPQWAPETGAQRWRHQRAAAATARNWEGFRGYRPDRRELLSWRPLCGPSFPSSCCYYQGMPRARRCLGLPPRGQEGVGSALEIASRLRGVRLFLEWNPRTGSRRPECW